MHTTSCISNHPSKNANLAHNQINQIMTAFSPFKFLILILTLSIGFSCQPKQSSTSDTDSSMDESAETEPQGFFKELTYATYSFRVTATDSSSNNTLVIEPQGQEIINDLLSHQVDGKVIGAEVTDLNGDQFPELIIYITAAGSGSYGSVIAYSSNNGKSMSQAFLEDIMETKIAKIGYMGHDQFLIADGKLTRRFQTYKDGDPNASPTGPIRQIQYRLVDGEASRLFEIDNMLEYPAK